MILLDEIAKIKEVDGNLIELALLGRFDIIVHGCNCQNIMGIGIAKQIKEVFPLAELQDYRYWKSFSKDSKRDMLGTLSYAKIDSFIVANLYTQFRPGPDFEIGNLKRALLQLFKKFGDVHYGFPHIGAGYGGGNWEEIKQVIYDYGEGYNITIVNYG